MFCTYTEPQICTISNFLLLLQGYTFNIGYIPFSFWGSADYDADAENPHKVFVNQSGGEPEMLDTVCKVRSVVQS